MRSLYEVDLRIILQSDPPRYISSHMQHNSSLENLTSMRSPEEMMLKKWHAYASCDPMPLIVFSSFLLIAMFVSKSK